MCPAPDKHPQDTPAQLSPLAAGEDIEKNVRVNEDGSLSVEMKVRFHLLGEELLLWSRRVGRASGLTAASGEGPVMGEADPLGCVWRGPPRDPSEPGAQGLGPCEAGGVGAFDRGRWQLGSRYEIWMNPLYAPQGEQTASQRRSGLTPKSHSRTPRSQGAASRKSRSEDSVGPSSSDRPPDGSETNSSCCPRSLEDGVGSCGPHLASGTGEGTGEGAMPGCRELHGCLKPGTRGPADALADSSASGGSHEESSERGELHQGHPSKKSRAVTSWGATQGGRPGSPAVSPSSIRKEGPRAEGRGQGSRHPRAASGEDAGGHSPPSACASAPGRSGKQESRASGLSSPGVSVLSRGSQRGRPRQHHHPKDSHCPLGLPVSGPVPGPPSRGSARPDSPAPGPSGSPHSPRSRASRHPGASFSASLPSRDTRGRSSVLISPVSNSDCVSNSRSPNSPAAEAEGDSEFRACSAAPTPSDTSVSFNSQADGPGERAGGDSPEPSWPSVLPVGRPEGGRPGAPRDSCCPQRRTSPALGPPGGKTRSLPASPSWGGQGPFSEACLVCSRCRPVPGKPRPSGKKRPLCTLSHGEGNPSADAEPGGAEAGQGELDAWHPRPPGSPGGALGRAVRAARRGGSHRGPKLARTLQENVSGGGDGLDEQEEGGCAMLGALPRASPGAVVRAWLSNIPEEPVKYEVADEGGDTAGRSPEGPEGDPVDRHAPDGPEGSVQARPLPPEGAAGEEAEPDAPLPVTSSAGPKSGEGLPCSGVPEAPTEAGKGKGAAVDRATGQGVLPRRVSSSVHIMKALMGSRPGRPSSVPEVSSSAGRRLGRSAQALITCLARLRFLDDDLGSPAGKVRFTDSPRYQELLSTFQALWPGSGLGHRELDSGLQELGWGQALPALGSHAAAEDFTPTSSSGVDVGSGSGGSGEGHGPCTVDCALVPERMGLPSGIPCQRPDSRISGNPEDPGNQQPSGSKAGGASSEDKAEGNSGEQMLGDDLDQGVKNTMQEEGAQSEEIKEEKEGAEVQEEAVKGFPEEEGVTGRELSGAGSQDGAGAREDKSLQGEEGDPTSATLSPPGKRESPTERPRSLGESDPDASGSQGGPDAEPSLEKLSTAAETGCGQTQAKLAQGAEERGTSTARRGPLDPDPLWASKLLKKMEKAFMAHLAMATAELQARWGLESNELLDRMVAELQQDVGRRLQDSIKQELCEVQSLAGGTAPGPPREALRWETPLQAKQHRRHLQGLSDLSAFSEHTRGRGPPSFSMEEDVPTFGGALGTRLGEQAEEEEFCPCEACVRKKVVPASPRDAVRAAGGPVREVFDLQQILQKKKGRCADGETAEAAPAKRGMEPLERDPSGTDPVRGADGGPELGSGQGPGVEEGDETLSRDEAPRGAEEGATAEKREREIDPFVGSYPDGVGRGEQGVGREEGDPEVGSGAEGTGPGEAPGGGDPSPGGHNAGAEAQGAEGKQQPESGGGNQGKREAHPQLGLGHRQSREASRISSPDQEGRRTPSVAPGADSPRQRPGLKSGLSCSSISSLGSRSQLSQKSSEDEPSDRHTRSTEDEAKGVPDPETKVTDTWPESSPSEQEGAPSGSRTPERGTDEGLTPEQGTEGGSDLEAEKVVKSLASTGVMLKSLPMDGTDGFGQDDLDF
nr:retinitis pigmentosa 1-like 1 protein [Kogia breviceps]